MSISRPLKAKLVEKGVSCAEMATALGLDASTFSRKLNGMSDFKRLEIQIIRNVLNLSVEESEAIFFAS